jgi:hypothetical protein
MSPRCIVPLCVQDCGTAATQPRVRSRRRNAYTATTNGWTHNGRERLLVALQGDLRWESIYYVTSFGGSGLTWQLTRSAEKLVGGMALTIQNPMSSLVFLAGTGVLTVNDPVWANNDWVLWDTPGAAVVPADLAIATLTCSGAITGAALTGAAIVGDSLSVTGRMDCDGASHIGGALGYSGALTVSGHTSAATVNATGAISAGELRAGGGLDRLGHRDVAGLGYYQLGREGGHNAIMDLLNSGNSTSIRLDCAQAMAQKTGSTAWVGISETPKSRTRL